MALRSSFFFEGQKSPIRLKSSGESFGTEAATGDTAQSTDNFRKLTESPDSNIYRFFKEPQFSDFSIVTSDERTIQVHRCVLASWSSYFYSLFSCRCVESISNCLYFSDLSQEDLLPILNEMYGNEVELTEEKLHELIVIADRLDAKKLVHKFTKVCQNYVQPHNVLKSLQFAREFNLFSLADYCRNVICHSIFEYSYRPEFGELRDDDVEYLLGCQEVSCQSEMDLLATVCRWANYDFSGRIVSAFWLLFSLRYKFARRSNFNESIIKKYQPKFKSLIDKFRDILEDVERLMRLSDPTDVDQKIIAILKDYMRNTSRSRSVNCEAASVFQPPASFCFNPDHWFLTHLQPRGTKEVVFLFGGWSGKEPSNLIQVLNPITYQWTVTTLTLPEMRIYYAAAEINGIIYIIGGFDNNSRGLKSTWAFDPLTESWTQKQSMFESRCYASSVVYENKIVVMGGYDDTPQPQGYVELACPDAPTGRRFKSVEMYCPLSDRWFRCCDMLHVRSDAAAVMFGGIIYCIGGFTGQEIHNSVECLDPRLLMNRFYNKSPYLNEYMSNWFSVASMKHKRSGVSCEVAGDYIYAVGGYNGEIQLDSIERYKPDINRWMEVSHMRIPRSNMGLLGINDRIIIVGGYGNDYTTQSCEEFNPNTLTSQPIEDLPLPEGCSGVKLVVAHGFGIARRCLEVSGSERLLSNEKRTNVSVLENNSSALPPMVSTSDAATSASSSVSTSAESVLASSASASIPLASLMPTSTSFGGVSLHVEGGEEDEAMGYGGLIRWEDIRERRAHT